MMLPAANTSSDESGSHVMTLVNSPAQMAILLETAAEDHTMQRQQGTEQQPARHQTVLQYAC